MFSHSNQLSSSDIPHSDLYIEMILDVFQEHLRQARQTFNLSVIAIAASILISMIGASLLISGKAPEGTVTAATGLFSTTFCTKIAKQCSQKLAELTKNLSALGSSVRRV